MSFDHGMLNLPLAKRGDIDAQLDRYKAEQAAASKAVHKATMAASRERAAKAKSALADLLARPDALESNAARLGVTTAELKRSLKKLVTMTPQKIINTRDKWLATA